MDADELRREYLRRVAVIAPRSGWDVLGYALMSSHIHWVLVCRGAPISKFVQPLHTGFAAWVNRRQNRSGHVFAQRPATIVVNPEDTLRVLAYVHNNPVRADVVSSASESSWTSHRYYCGLQSPPDWLRMRLGLKLSGFDDKSGQASFDEFVTAQANNPRDPVLSGTTSIGARVRIREVLGVPVELASPCVNGNTNRHGVVVRTKAKQPTRSIDPHRVIEYVANLLGVESTTVLSRSRSRCVAKARRLILVICCQHLDQRISTIAGLLGISVSSASDLLYRRPERAQELHLLAGRIVSSMAKT